MPEIETYYEQYWESPEDYNDPTAPQRQALFRERTSLPKGAKILDVGRDLVAGGNPAKAVKRWPVTCDKFEGGE